MCFNLRFGGTTSEMPIRKTTLPVSEGTVGHSLSMANSDKQFPYLLKRLNFALSLEILGKEPFQREVEDLLQSTATRVFVCTCSLRDDSLKVMLVCFVFLCSQGADAGFSLHEIMPSHLRLRALTDKCRNLTETWHGRVPRSHVRGNTVVRVTMPPDYPRFDALKANISYMYEMFMKMAERDGPIPRCQNVSSQVATF